MRSIHTNITSMIYDHLKAIEDRVEAKEKYTLLCRSDWAEGWGRVNNVMQVWFESLGKTKQGKKNE